MKVLVTGSNGYVGKSIVKELSKKYTVLQTKNSQDYFVDGKVDSIYDICDTEIGEYLHDLWLIQGLDTENPMTVTPTSREVETIRQTILGDGKTTSTITRTA